MLTVTSPQSPPVCDSSLPFLVFPDLDIFEEHWSIILLTIPQFESVCFVVTKLKFRSLGKRTAEVTRPADRTMAGAIRFPTRPS